MAGAAATIEDFASGGLRARRQQPVPSLRGGTARYCTGRTTSRRCFLSCAAAAPAPAASASSVGAALRLVMKLRIVANHGRCGMRIDVVRFAHLLDDFRCLHHPVISLPIDFRCRIVITAFGDALIRSPAFIDDTLVAAPLLLRAGYSPAAGRAAGAMVTLNT